MLQFLLIFLLMFIVMSMITGRKQKKAELEILQKKLDEYSELTKEQIIDFEDDKIVEMACFQLQDITAGSYMNALEVLNEEQKYVYALYQLETSVSSKNVSVNDFFVRASELIDMVPKILEQLNLLEAKRIYEEAYQLYLDIQKEYERDIDEVIDELYDDTKNYGNEKNFDDYSKELKEIFTSEAYMHVLAQFIKEHIDSFIGNNENEED